jgi:polysaccharide export outer membrane protein
MTWKMTADHGSLGRYRARFCLLLLVASIVGLSRPARADYVPQRGDVLEIMVSGVPALSQRLAVNSDGKIVLPILGEVEAADMPLTELGRRLQDLLAARNVVRHSEVIVSVAEYRPIYLSGDVLKPGEYRYRPEMTVRQAVALAGGYDTLENQARLSPAQIADARGELGAAAIEYARQKARAARLRAELDESEVFEIGDAAEQSVDQAVISEIVSIEISQLKADRQADTRAKMYLQRMIGVARDQITALEQVETQQQHAFDQQSQNATRAGDLLRKGVGTISRAEEDQRVANQSRSELLEVRVRLAQGQKELAEWQRQLEVFDDNRKTKLLEALRDAVADAGKAQYQLNAARERLTSGRGTSWQMGVEPIVTIRRNAKGTSTQIAADLDTTLQSGDTVEIVDVTAPPSRLLKLSGRGRLLCDGFCRRQSGPPG